MASQYPKLIDGLAQIPKAKDRITPVEAELINTLRGAIINIQTELGTNPKGSYDSVRARLDSLEQSIEALENQTGTGKDFQADIDAINQIISEIQNNIESWETDLEGLELRLINVESFLQNITQDAASELGSGNATAGTVLTSDGEGGTRWEPAAAPLPLTTKGDIIVHDGNKPIRLPAGPDGYVLTSDPNSPEGLIWTEASSGSGEISLPTMERGDLIVFDGEENVRLPAGEEGQFLQVSNSSPSGLTWAFPNSEGNNDVFWSPFVRPKSPSIYDDEFSDKNLDPKWFLWTEGGATISESDHYVEVYKNGGGTEGLLQPLPPEDEFEVVAHISMGGIMVNYAFVGIVLSQNIEANPTTADFFFHALRAGGNGFDLLEGATWTAYNTFGSQRWSLPNSQLSNSAFLLLQFKQSTGEIHGWFSTDGIAWTSAGTYTWSGHSATHIGIGISALSNRALRSSFFRITRLGESGIIGSQPEPTGGFVKAGMGAGEPLPTTTKGDLIVHNGDENTRLPIGPDGYILIADSSDPLGVKWAEIEVSGGNGGAESLDDLMDVDLSNSPTDGQVLIYDADSQVWIPGDMAGGGGGAESLNDLIDVDISDPPTNGQVLTYDADSQVWIPGDVLNGGGGGNFTLIEEQVLESNGDFIFSDIPQDFDKLILEVIGRNANSDDDIHECFIQLGGSSIDSGNNYNYYGTDVNTNSQSVNATQASPGRKFFPGNNAAAGAIGVAQIQFFNYTDASKWKIMRGEGVGWWHDTPRVYWSHGGAFWTNTTDAIEKIRVFTQNTNFTAGTTAKLWGFKQSDGGGGNNGGEDLAATLILGNTTDGKDIVISSGDKITTTEAELGSGYSGAQLSFSTSQLRGDLQKKAATSYLTIEEVPLRTTYQELLIRFRFFDLSLDLLGIDGPRTSGGNNFNFGSPASSSPETQAQEIADAINDPANAFSEYLTASVDGNRINFVAKPEGHQGNRYTLGANFLPTNFTEQYNFSGGWEADIKPAYGYISILRGTEENPIGSAGGEIKIGDLTLTAVNGPRTPGGNNFQIDLPTHQDIIADIHDALTDPQNSFLDLISVTGGWSNINSAGVDIQAVEPGIAANNIKISTRNLTRFSVSGLEGGWEPKGSLLFDISEFGSISVLPGGEQRSGTIDLQVRRHHDGQIARGIGSAILGGYYNMIDDFGVDPGEMGTAGSAIVGIENTIQPRSGRGSYAVFAAGWGNKVGMNSAGTAIFGSGNVVDSYGWPYCTNSLVAGNGNKVISGENANSGSYNGFAVGLGNQIYGARDAIALGRFSYVGGYGVTADCSLAGGNGVTVRSYATIAWGFNHNTHPRSKASAIFGSGAYSYVPGQLVHTSVGTHGQASHYTLATQTTNDTPKEMSIDSGNPSVDNRLFIRPNSSYAFRIELSARQTAGTVGSIGDSASWSIRGLIKRDGDNNTVLVGVSGDGTPLFSDSNASAWSVTVTADDVNEALKVEVTGELNKTIRWLAYIYDSEVK